MHGTCYLSWTSKGWCVIRRSLGEAREYTKLSYILQYPYVPADILTCFLDLLCHLFTPRRNRHCFVAVEEVDITQQTACHSLLLSGTRRQKLSQRERVFDMWYTQVSLWSWMSLVSKQEVANPIWSVCDPSLGMVSAGDMIRCGVAVSCHGRATQQERSEIVILCDGVGSEMEGCCVFVDWMSNACWLRGCVIQRYLESQTGILLESQRLLWLMNMNRLKLVANKNG